LERSKKREPQTPTHEGRGYRDWVSQREGKIEKKLVPEITRLRKAKKKKHDKAFSDSFQVRKRPRKDQVTWRCRGGGNTQVYPRESLGGEVREEDLE